MAEITLTNPIFYAGGKAVSGASYVVGYESSRNRVVRYTMYSPSNGASNVSLSFTGNWKGNGTIPGTLYFYIGTSENSHANAGASSERTGTLAKESGTYNYSGSADIILLPDTTYYVWVFPASTNFGWVQWGVNNGDAVATTSGGAASSFTVSNGTLGTSQTIAVTKHSTEFTHTITYSCGTASGPIADKASNTSITWTPPLDLASQNTSGDTVVVTLTLQTYSGSTAIGSPVTRVATMTIPASVKPSIGAILVSDLMGYADTYGAYVKSLSRLSIDVVPITAGGSKIVSYKVKANGSTYTDASCTTDALKTSGTLYVTATVTDERGRTSDEASVSITVLDYTRPTIYDLSAQRCNANGTLNNSGAFVLVTFSATVTPLNNLNGAEYVLNYKKPSAVDWNGVALDDLYGDYSVKDYTYIFEADTASSYIVEVTVEDNHLGSPYSTTAPTAFALIHPNPSGTGLAVCKLSEKENSFEVGAPMYDRFGTLAGFGIASYSGGGDAGIDPDTTTEELCLTSHSHAPQGLGTFYYIHTVFYNTKSATAARSQMAMPYNKSGSMYHRHYSGGAWSSWSRYMTADETYPVGSVVIRYDSTSPATLYGGTWQRIEGRILFGCASSGTIGATGSHTTGSGSSSLPYVNVAIWRRTA